MYVVEVIPFIRGSAIESLTYYASSPIPEGSVVTVPVRSKEVSGMVASCQPVSAAKAAIRAATFSLRKLPSDIAYTALPPALIETATRLTTTTPTTVGAALFALLPPEVRDGTQVLHTDTGGRSGELLPAPAVSVLQDLTDERYRVYRSHIREAFAHRGSVLFLVPTSADVDRVLEELARGIEDRIAVFSPRYGAKKIERAYESLHDLSRAKLIIATPRHAFIDRHDLTTVIIDQSRSPYYKSKVRPYFDTREVMKTVASVTGRSILLGDILPSAEDEHARRQDRYQTADEHPKRLTFVSAFKVVKQNERPTAEAPFQLFSKQLIHAIETVAEKRTNLLLLAARRGLAPVVVCIDCGHIFRCPDSGTPYSLIKTVRDGAEERWFVSSTSGRRVRAADTCTSCGSWRLTERGIGIQQIEAELKKRFPDLPVVLFDHTTATTYKKAQNLIHTFYSTKGAVLLATPMALPYLYENVEHTAIVSLDAARAMHTWRADEELFALLLTLRERTNGIVYVQTRTDPDRILEHATRGLVEQFYNDELELRQALSYPPYSVFVHLSYTDTKEKIAEIESVIAETVRPHKPQFYTAGEQNMRNALLRIPRSGWPDASLMNRLRTLPPSVRIEIYPHKIV